MDSFLDDGAFANLADGLADEVLCDSSVLEGITDSGSSAGNDGLGAGISAKAVAVGAETGKLVAGEADKCEDLLEGLNEPQREAVQTTEGPVLVLAGAGSGKTTVLTRRIAWILRRKLAKPGQILGVTFTNKAATELSERLRRLCGVSNFSNVGTFHSVCSKWLRREAEHLGISKEFTIYDGSAQKTLMKDVLKELELDSQKFDLRTVLVMVSRYKNDNAIPRNMIGSSNPLERCIKNIYDLYNQKLRDNGALDFDDILAYSVKLLRDFPDIRAAYQEKFKYIMVDEYQDVNPVQYQLLRLLTSASRNICAVGDDDQSIYKFRGADLTIILNFETDFPDAKIIKLEQNYRSTQAILDAANQLVSCNRGRKGKKLWSNNRGEGKPLVYGAMTSQAEAEFVARKVETLLQEGFKPGDCVVLYRANAMSRNFEETFIHHGIPAKLVGGQRFYERQEIRDLLAYLWVIKNLDDSVSLQRVLENMKGIGAKTLQKLTEWGGQEGVSLHKSLAMAEALGVSKTISKQLRDLQTWFEELHNQARDKCPLAPLLAEIMEYSDYVSVLRQRTANEAEFEGRKENIDELLAKVRGFDASYSGLEAPIDAFLNEVSLYSDQDSLDREQDMVTLMTIHTSKGLEFPVVFLVGLEEDTLPIYLSLQTGRSEDVEEERRLCYVGMTRAKRRLFLTYAAERNKSGFSQEMTMSRFLYEAGKEHLDITGQLAKKAFIGDTDDWLDKICELEATSSRRPVNRSMYETEKGLRRALERREIMAERASTPEEKRAALLPSYLPKSKPRRHTTRAAERHLQVAAKFYAGCKVRHKLFGVGKVQSTSKDTVVVMFGNNRERCLSAEYLEVIDGNR